VPSRRVLVTGGKGQVGRALQRVLPGALYLSSAVCDLRDLQQTKQLFEGYSPDYVIHLAAKVGGIKANMENLGAFYTDNVYINTNVLDCARDTGVKKVVSLLSTCVYPDEAVYPLQEDQIHNGKPHASNYAYAYAKRMLDVQSRAYRDQYGCNFITIVPNNLFGEHDNFDLDDSHVIPAIIRKMHEANLSGQDVTLWGDGSPLREFTYSGDLARILLFVMEAYDGDIPLNVGNTQEISIKEVAYLISDLINFKGDIVWDTSKPAGQHRKPSDNSNFLKLGWKKSDYSNFKDSLSKVCEWFIMNYPEARGT